MGENKKLKREIAKLTRDNTALRKALESSQLAQVRLSADGMAYMVIGPCIADDKFNMTIRDVAKQTGYSIAAIQKTRIWRMYMKAKGDQRERARLQQAGRALRRAK